jgi:hypothetical protein
VRSRALRQARLGAWPVNVPVTSSLRIANEIAKKAPNKMPMAAAVPRVKMMRVHSRSSYDQAVDLVG